ncbi:MAG TPA: PIN domain-containing protein [Thiolinea sp.]|nr:PIN domain-containing protein [Thiolinea sp.]
MKILFDTNVILDVILNRQPFAPNAILLVAAVEEKRIQGLLCATTLITIDYLVSKALGTESSRATLKKLLQLFEVAAVDYPVIQAAIESDIKDFEDAVLYEAAKRAGALGIVTRNKGDFSPVDLPIYLPDELAAIAGLLRVHEEVASYKVR